MKPFWKISTEQIMIERTRKFLNESFHLEIRSIAGS